MKPFWWFLAVLTIFYWGIYVEMREIQREQINLPVAVAR
jgi:hypothetical protein